MSSKRKPPKHRSASAAALSHPLFRKQIVPNKKRKEEKALSRKVIRPEAADDTLNE